MMVVVVVMVKVMSYSNDYPGVLNTHIRWQRCSLILSYIKKRTVTKTTDSTSAAEPNASVFLLEIRGNSSGSEAPFRRSP